MIMLLSVPGVLPILCGPVQTLCDISTLCELLVAGCSGVTDAALQFLADLEPLQADADGDGDGDGNGDGDGVGGGGMETGGGRSKAVKGLNSFKISDLDISGGGIGSDSDGDIGSDSDLSLGMGLGMGERKQGMRLLDISYCSNVTGQGLQKLQKCRCVLAAFAHSHAHTVVPLYRMRARENESMRA